MISFDRLEARYSVSPETLEGFVWLVDRVIKWNPTINLVSKASLVDIADRHILDSLQLIDLAPLQFGHWVDMGSGGGFPGLVVAIYGHFSGRLTRMTLIDSDVRKAVFLREVARELALPVDVINERVDKIEPLNADVLSARAFAPLVDLCHYSKTHMKDAGSAIFPKGANYRAEIDEAHKSWNFHAMITPSQTSPDSAILTLKDIAHV